MRKMHKIFSAATKFRQITYKISPIFFNLTAETTCSLLPHQRTVVFLEIKISRGSYSFKSTIVC
jgi:hypothetical protein